MLYLLNFYVTPHYLNIVKNAVLKTGAGSYQGFKNCAWETLGQGQYQVENEALTQNAEYKVEILCQEQHLNAAISALKDSHPCDEPAFFVLPLKEL